MYLAVLARGDDVHVVRVLVGGDGSGGDSLGGDEELLSGLLHVDDVDSVEATRSTERDERRQFEGDRGAAGAVDEAGAAAGVVLEPV